MKRVLFIGRSGSGKTTLCQRLHDQVPAYRKTQAMEFWRDSIDTPGEYLENRRFYNALIMTAAEADVVALVADPTAGDAMLPPGFAGAFGRPVIGVVTKAVPAAKGRIDQAIADLRRAGARPIFVVDSVSGQGMGLLAQALRRKEGTNHA